ncbi:hypothetical protein BU23DRAFT_1261 [Bimuria novae-zelandiae CBS 107.79]|uniref:Uncharacterized protein n=1 Tax=Bimuria novae-zelandiae CBS 107.79 TaxID=1447943 RepID=A0A6A5VS25_9PLEO|nr:hypothetical protein BU23DRAFT_1261 [Bimuria novae-zelandiae CBS 107.79]
MPASPFALFPTWWSGTGLCKADDVSVANHTDIRRLANPCIRPSGHPDWPYTRDAPDGEGEAHPCWCVRDGIFGGRHGGGVLCCGEENFSGELCEGLCRIQKV